MYLRIWNVSGFFFLFVMTCVCFGEEDVVLHDVAFIRSLLVRVKGGLRVSLIPRERRAPHAQHQ